MDAGTIVEAGIDGRMYSRLSAGQLGSKTLNDPDQGAYRQQTGCQSEYAYVPLAKTSRGPFTRISLTCGSASNARAALAPRSRLGLLLPSAVVPLQPKRCLFRSKLFDQRRSSVFKSSIVDILTHHSKQLINCECCCRHKLAASLCRLHDTKITQCSTLQLKSKVLY